MPVQVFADESGGKGHGRYFVMAALLAQAEAWAGFSEEWRACLEESPRIRIFKMRDAAGCNGEFRNWKESDRDAKLRKLARIINRYAEVVFHSVIDLDAHAKLWANNPKPMNEPYFYPFQNTILAACLHLWDAGLRERFEIIFDENLIFGPRAKVWYPVMREVLKYREPDAYSISPVDPLFRPDEEFLPIQAADFFAWCFRNGTTNPDDRKFNWLLDGLGNVIKSDYSQIYDEPRMQSVANQRDELLLDRTEMQEIFKRVYGHEPNGM